VVSLGGLPDLELAATPPGSGCGTEVIEKLVGPATLSSRHVFADTSVPRLAPLGVRQVLINGRQDRIIPPNMPMITSAGCEPRAIRWSCGCSTGPAMLS
jgi:hypothetical protein